MSGQPEIVPVVEDLDPHQIWFRVTKPHWDDPLDTYWSAETGGRWNPKGVEALYLNEDVVTARLNLRLYVDRFPYYLNELLTEALPVLIHVSGVEGKAADAHTPEGLEALGLPATYPQFEDGTPIPREHCQPIGAAIRDMGIDGVKYRSARTEWGEGRELCWYPRKGRRRPAAVGREGFSDWYWR